MTEPLQSLHRRCVPFLQRFHLLSSGYPFGIFAEDDVTESLRIMGIPEFSSITLTEGDLNAIVPTEAINLVFGSAWSEDKAITIRLNATECRHHNLHPQRNRRGTSSLNPRIYRDSGYYPL